MAAVLLVLAGCGSRPSDEDARRHAAARLRVPASSLRVTSRSDLTTSDNEFFLVTREGGKPMTVVVRRGEPPFDEQTPGGFDRVARHEDATRRLSQIGAERIALWFSAFDQKTCGPPVAEAAHFATVETVEAGVRIRFPFLIPGGTRACILELAADGSLRGAQAEKVTASARGPARSWASDRMN